MSEQFHHPGPRRIRAQAAALGLQQKDLAERMGVSPNSVGLWFRGEMPPSRSRLEELEEALELDPGELSVLFGYLPAGASPTIEREGDLVTITVDVGGSIPG